MRPVMLLLFSLPVLLGVLVLTSAPLVVEELTLPPRTQWSWVHRLRAAEFSADCHNGLRGGLRGVSARVVTSEASDGGVRISCHLSGARHLPGA
jgi:hypothetical protein